MLTEQGSYEAVIGLEVHAQLLTQTKLFCGDSAAFGAEPNTHISPVTMALPGSLPVLNARAISFAVKMGLACHCEITRTNYFARKNYFYPDLPKGYQISQHIAPICRGGFVSIRTASGEKQIELNRIHLEEDAGKSLHDIEPDYTCIDLNRAGVPLIEIVTEPVLQSSEQAYVFLTELRKILRFLEVCDGNMEEGSLRCDANISIRKKGVAQLGTKVEVKNLNSIRNVKRAIDFEIARMTEMVLRDEPIIQQTRSFDAQTGTSFALRNKEEANDYRYFPDPDLPPFQISDAMLEQISRSIPALPEELIERYTTFYQLSDYDAVLMSADKATAAYFEALAALTLHYKAAANWLLGPVRSWLNERGLEMNEFVIAPQSLVKLINLVETGKLGFSVASSRILPAMISQPSAEPEELAITLNLLQSADAGEISQWVEQVLLNMPDKVEEYRRGKKGLLGLFVGEVKKISGGKADLKLTNQLLLEKLDKK